MYTAPLDDDENAILYSLFPNAESQEDLDEELEHYLSRDH